jgi:hypothetical protein
MKISKEKFKDLMELCKSNVIPKVYHDFYKNLPHVGQDEEQVSDDEDDNFLDQFFVNEIF